MRDLERDAPGSISTSLWSQTSLLWNCKKTNACSHSLHRVVLHHSQREGSIPPDDALSLLPPVPVTTFCFSRPICVLCFWHGFSRACCISIVWSLLYESLIICPPISKMSLFKCHFIKNYFPAHPICAFDLSVVPDKDPFLEFISF